MRVIDPSCERSGEGKIQLRVKPYCLAVLLFAGIAFPSRKSLAQQAYFEEENFPSPASEISLVNGIAADSNNCIWLTTQSGVYRYDGYKFRHYSTLNTSAIKFERMGGIHTVWKKNKLEWCIRDAKWNFYRTDKLSQLRSLTPGKQSQIVFGRYTLEVWNENRQRLSPLDSLGIYEVHCSGKRELFYILRNDGGINKISVAAMLKGEQSIPVGELPGNTPMKLGNENSFKLFTTDNGLYVVTLKGLMRMVDSSGVFQPVLLEGDIRKDKSTTYGSTLIFPPVGNASILMWHEGDIYELKESFSTNSIQTKLLARGLPRDVPSFLYYSPVHELLMGCFLNRGLVLYRPRQFSLLTYSGPESRLSDNYYYTVVPADSGYITVNNTGIVLLGLNGTSRVLYRGRLGIYFLYRDKAGNIWFHKSAKYVQDMDQVSYLEAKTYRYVSVFYPGFNNVLTGTYQHDDSSYYMLTNTTFHKVILKNGQVNTQLLFESQKKEAFNVLYALDAHRLWIGYDQGMMEFDIRNNSFKAIPALANTNIRAVTKLGENNYLVGTYDKWIFQYKNGEWSHLSSSDNETASSVHGFIIDSSSNSLWLSSNKGISRIPLHRATEINARKGGKIYTEHFGNFGKDISIEFNGSSNMSAARLSDTNAAFANAAGLVVFNPRMSISSPLPVTVLVESVHENDSAAIKDTDSRQLQFNVVVPYYGNRGNLEVLYRMTNTDDDWHLLLQNTIISYNNLRPGPHDLQFRIKNHSDADEKQAVFTAGSFYIPYRWYETAWFRITILALIILAFVSLHYFRIWYLLKRKRELKKLVKIKTAELQEINDNLVSVIEELSVSEANLKQSNFLKDEYYAVLTHDLRSPLKFLSFNISQLLELSPELKHEPLKKGLFAAYQCSNDVYKLVDEFVYWIQNNENQLKVEPSATNVSRIVEDAKKMYELGLDGNHNSFVTDIDSNLTFITDPKLLFIVLRNAIDNANKYTSGGTINVSAIRQNNNLVVTVSDTGRGINEEKVKLLMEIQYGNVQLSYKQRKSLGFYIMAMLTKMLGGNYTIGSTMENGTSLRFTLPELKE